MMDDTLNETFEETRTGDNDYNYENESDDPDADDPASVTSSNIMEVGSTGEGERYNLRRRVYDARGVLQVSRTPSPSPSRSSPEDDLVSKKRSRFQNKAGRSFAELSKEYEEKEKLTKLGVETSKKKTLEDFFYKGVANNKRNVPFSLQGRFSDMVRRLSLGPSAILNIMFAAFAIAVVSLSL